MEEKNLITAIEEFAKERKISPAEVLSLVMKRLWGTPLLLNKRTELKKAALELSRVYKEIAEKLDLDIHYKEAAKDLQIGQKYKEIWLK